MVMVSPSRSPTTAPRRGAPRTAASSSSLLLARPGFFGTTPSMRGIRSPLVVVMAVLALVALVGAPRPAHADVKKDIEQKIKQAMESYDLFEYEEARKTLNTALTLAKKNKLESAPVVAKVHI